MHTKFIEILRCPRSGQRLNIENPIVNNERIQSGELVSEDGRYSYPIKDFVPRFVPKSNYADNFGIQWNKFRLTQLDSFSGHPISSDRFWAATGWSADELKGRWVLDIGCGAGRFAEVALNAGAKVVALDYSSAIDACYANLKHHPNLYAVQGDVYSLPFAAKSFPFIYSLGVLQHTPDVAKSFSRLPPLLDVSGKLCVDFYWKRFRTMMHAKYLFRPFTKTVETNKLFSFLEKAVPYLLICSQILGRVPVAGKVLKRVVPVADYTGRFPLSDKQLKEWALLDTFDMLAPEYDNPQSVSTVKKWFEEENFHDIEVFHAAHLVGRGRK